jgi:hypothetical protein
MRKRPFFLVLGAGIAGNSPSLPTKPARGGNFSRLLPKSGERLVVSLPELSKVPCFKGFENTDHRRGHDSAYIGFCTLFTLCVVWLV